MLAMLLEATGRAPAPATVPRPEPGRYQVLLKVLACGVCRTDLHIADGELPHPKLPLILGHEIVGEVVSNGPEARRFAVGTRAGVPWLGWTCGTCRYCRSGRENLCDRARFTGYDLDGGYAEYAVADERYCFALPEALPPAEAAPLLCAGLIGYRSLLAAGDGAERLGVYGFGAAAHIVAQVARAQGRRVFAFTRPGDQEAWRLAREMGAEWVGPSDTLPPEPLDAAIIFAPVGALVPAALRGGRPGRHGGLRRHPHERHPCVPLRPAVGRAGAALGGQPDPARRRGVPRPRPARSGADGRGALPSVTRRRGTRSVAGGKRARCSGPGA